MMNGTWTRRGIVALLLGAGEVAAQAQQSFEEEAAAILSQAQRPKLRVVQ